MPFALLLVRPVSILDTTEAECFEEILGDNGDTFSIILTLSHNHATHDTRPCRLSGDLLGLQIIIPCRFIHNPPHSTRTGERPVVSDEKTVDSTHFEIFRGVDFFNRLAIAGRVSKAPELVIESSTIHVFRIVGG
ncbi:hypothetical protein D3C77_568470 [compost metagenome]